MFLPPPPTPPFVILWFLFLTDRTVSLCSAYIFKIIASYEIFPMKSEQIKEY